MSVACDPTSVNNGAACFTCVSEKQLLAAQVYLTWQWLMTVNPSAAPTLQAVLDNSACFSCAVSHKQLLAAMVYLLCQIQGGGGGGGGGGTQQVFSGASPPASPTNAALPALWYPTGGGGIKEWINSSNWF